LAIETVFVSSVVRGFEAERRAAREAIGALDLRPVMCEDFGARDYSSAVACITEVEQSDAYVLVLGSEYGYETEEGISVTQAEFQAARHSHRPILAFVQDTNYEGKQAEFKREVEAYQGGLFRESFSTSAELKDGIIRALNRLRTKDRAGSTEDFDRACEEAVRQVTEHHGPNDDPELILISKPQPDRRVQLMASDLLNKRFIQLCDLGYCQLSAGYEAIGHADWVGLKSGPSRLAQFSDGLVLVTHRAAPESNGLLAGQFLPPDILRERASSFLAFVDNQSGFVYFGLRNMENGYVARHPGGDSLSMRMWGSGDSKIGFSELFVPLTPGDYLGWIDWCIGKLKRQYPYET
jgi:hypothetical protein